MGIRKVVGAELIWLIGQFIGESLLLTAISVSVALLEVSFLLPSFNSLTVIQITVPVGEPLFWQALLGLTCVTGLVAGNYPAFFMSSLNPVRVLKGISPTPAYLPLGLNFQSIKAALMNPVKSLRSE